MNVRNTRPSLVQGPTLKDSKDNAYTQSFLPTGESGTPNDVPDWYWKQAMKRPFMKELTRLKILIEVADDEVDEDDEREMAIDKLAKDHSAAELAEMAENLDLEVSGNKTAVATAIVDAGE